MSFCVKLALAKKLSQASKSNVGSIFKSLRLSLQPHEDSVSYSLPCKSIEADVNTNKLIEEGEAHISNENIILPINKTDFISQVLLSNINRSMKSDYQTLLNDKDKVVVDFSSPNIAKPFHVGHFRGTVLGNFVSNVSEYFASDVIRLNYLGDWGTQFGLIQIGLRELNIDSKDLEQNALDTLYKAYVKANSMAKTRLDVQKQASDIFQKLELSVDSEHTQDWLDFRQVTVNELKLTYERLGIAFNEYNWESDYAAGKIPHILTGLKHLPGIVKEGDHLLLPVGDRKVTLVKSNGSTMYVTRDIAAAVDRQSKHQFSKMLYVTDFSQEDHFKDLVHILRLLGHSWCENIEHIKYGKVQGMSSREGKGVFLKDLLDEARDRMNEKQKDTKTTRVSLDDTGVSDALGMSALIVYNLKMKRMKTSNFNWNDCLQMSGDGGVKLQYSHCRLVSLLHECDGIQLPETCDPTVLQEPVAQQLVLDIARFDDVLYQSYESYEPCVLVRYLMDLTNSINKALKQLKVKGSEPHVAEQRLLLFNRARLVLKEAMSLLGIKVLDSM
uniref:Probable arginine--tRNA ligase, mitochondrial n=1 Tax=Cacopsylla melanoneura TaxID=428564 RepID=A0A8D9AVG7_9HEMI